MGSRVLYLRPWALNDPVKSSFQGKEQKKVPWAVEYQNPGLSWIYPGEQWQTERVGEGPGGESEAATQGKDRTTDVRDRQKCVLQMAEFSNGRVMQEDGGVATGTRCGDAAVEGERSAEYDEATEDRHHKS